VLALLSKPSASVIPLFALLLEFALYDGANLRDSARRIAPWLIPTLIIVVVTKLAQDMLLNTRSLDVPYWVRPLQWGDAFFFYVTKLVYPFGLSACQSRTVSFLNDLGVWYWTSTASVLLLAGAVALRRRIPCMLLSVSLFVAGFLPVSGLVVFGFETWSTVASRYVYMSMLGAGLLFAQLGRRGVREIYLTIAIVFLIFWAVVSGLMQVPVWRNRFSLWNEALAVSPANPGALQNRAAAYAAYGHWKEMLHDLNLSISLQRHIPVATTGHLNYKAVLANLNWRIVHDSRAQPDRVPLDFLTRAYVHLKLGDLKAALNDLDVWQSHAQPFNLGRISKMAVGLRNLPEPERRRELLKLARETWGKEFPALFSGEGSPPQ
jgi:tetratricopeptide (TPR) repeat protein